MIKQIDLQDDTALRQAHEALERSSAVDRPWFEPTPYDEWVADVRFVEPEERFELWGAWEDDSVVGAAMVWLPDADNTWMLWTELDVHPDHRGRGHGTGLVEQMVSRARDEKRTTVLTEFRVPQKDFENHPYRRFALARGFEPGWVENVRHMPLPVSEELLTRHGDASAKAAEAYDVKLFAGDVPDEYVQGLCDLYNLLGVDAPSGVVEFEPETMTPKRVRDFWALQREQGRTRLFALAIDRETGAVAAHSDLVVPPPPSTQVWQWGTYVHRDHRGHRLGMAVKVANLRRLQEEFPGRTLVRTSNADNNAYMVAINEDLGFEIVEKGVAMRLPVAAAE
ncbi:GNAT family N-acetyltransferase [Luteipulveratus flavus]|uniref:GNAT family N-acetyltransferase n=1 Tax=Luteipulveratus flavus TaxID=3031728 RepID=A0ABT6C9D8_9MICO|nr:GNAT family N-acetyltransferase [Luteipulveratus sp. YIM 133296]MDF8265515.1 GNAT family N-acetyltransferase [Luteipulveratus sp. YIM 133296]